MCLHWVLFLFFRSNLYIREIKSIIRHCCWFFFSVISYASALITFLIQYTTTIQRNVLLSEHISSGFSTENRTRSPLSASWKKQENRRFVWLQVTQTVWECISGKTPWILKLQKWREKNRCTTPKICFQNDFQDIKIQFFQAQFLVLFCGNSNGATINPMPARLRVITRQIQ